MRESYTERNIYRRLDCDRGEIWKERARKTQTEMETETERDRERGCGGRYLLSCPPSAKRPAEVAGRAEFASSERRAHRRPRTRPRPN